MHQVARLPQPPIKTDNASLHRSLTDIITFLRQNYDAGSKHPSFTQQQIDSFTQQNALGTLLFNSTTNESNISYLDGADVKWRAV